MARKDNGYSRPLLGGNFKFHFLKFWIKKPIIHVWKSVAHCELQISLILWLSYIVTPIIKEPFICKHLHFECSFCVHSYFPVLEFFGKKLYVTTIISICQYCGIRRHAIIHEKSLRLWEPGKHLMDNLTTRVQCPAIRIGWLNSNSKITYTEIFNIPFRARNYH